MPLERVDLNDKTCIVTGANSGIGLETAMGLIEMGACVVLACRNMKAGQEAVNRIQDRTGFERTELMELDLGSQRSIRTFAERFSKAHDRLDILINNAAVIPKSRQETEDGLEMQFGVNHIGPFLLTHLLLDRLKAAAPSRIVNVSSMVHYNAELNFDDLQNTQGYKAFGVYKQSKLANVLFSYELARRLEGTGVTVNCLHPGVVRTGLMRNTPFFLKPFITVAGLFMIGPAKGAETSLYVATSPELEVVTGKYFRECRESRSAPPTHDEALAERLWDISAEMAGVEP